MTNSGSGNQGITVYLPVVVAAEKFGAPVNNWLVLWH